MFFNQNKFRRQTMMMIDGDSDNGSEGGAGDDGRQSKEEEDVKPKEKTNRNFYSKLDGLLN